MAKKIESSIVSTIEKKVIKRGVRGLFRFLEEKKIYKTIDLIEISKKKRLKIIVETCAFMNIVNHVIPKYFRRLYDNNFLFVPLSELDILDNVYYDLHMAFKEANIDIIWIIGGQDSNCASYEVQIRRKDLKDMNARNDAFETLSKCESLDDSRFGFRWFETFIEQLKRAEAQIIYTTEGEKADYVARISQETGAYAILANNSDFTIFEECNLLHGNYLRRCYGEDLLDLPFVDTTNSGKIFKPPTVFFCPIINCDMILNRLEITHDQLITVALLKGNCYSSEYSQDLSALVRLTGGSYVDPYIDTVFNFVKKQKTYLIERWPDLRAYMWEHPDILASINECRQYYKLKRDLKPRSDGDIDDLTKFVLDAVESQRMVRVCYSMHFGKLRNQILLEEVDKDEAGVTDTLGQIREQIYPYILKRSLPCVKEWSPNLQIFVEIKVTHSDIKSNQIIGIPDGLKIFEDIWSHKEPETLNFVKRFGLEMSIILYSLRYLHKIKKKKMLCLTDLEMKAAFISVLYRYATNNKMSLKTKVAKEDFLKMKICPSPRCVTIGKWFSKICCHAYYYCPGVLNFMDQIRSPFPCMNGSELYAFYETMNGDGSRLGHLSQDLITCLNDTGDEIVELFQKEYEAVMN